MCILNTVSLFMISVASVNGRLCTPLGWHLSTFLFVMTRFGISFCQLKSVQRSSVTTYATLRNWGCLARRSCRLRGGAGDAECHARGHADGANDSNRQEGGAEWQLSGGPGTAGASPTGTPSTSKSSRTHDSRSYSYPSDDVQLKTISEHDQAVYECHYGCSR